VFIDETWTSTNMTRRYGRAPRGTTFVAGLRHRQLTAPMVADGPMDGEMFLAYVRQFLCPTLQPGDVVILDNLASHKVAGVNELSKPYGMLLASCSTPSLELNAQTTLPFPDMYTLTLEML
jgi:transposase